MNERESREKVNLDLIMDKGKIYVSVESLVFIKNYLPDADIVATIETHVNQFQLALQGLPTDDDFKLKVENSEKKNPDAQGSSEAPM